MTELECLQKILEELKKERASVEQLSSILKTIENSKEELERINKFLTKKFGS